MSVNQLKPRGFCSSSMIWVPAYAIYFLLTTEGSLRERLRKGITPQIKMRQDAVLRPLQTGEEQNGREVEMALVNDRDATNHV